MKSKNIITVSLVVLVGATAFFLWWQRVHVDIPPTTTATLVCPDSSFSDTRTFLERLLSFTTPVFATPPRQAIESRLCFLGKPSLNTPITLLYKFKSERAVPDIIAKIKLPENFVLVSGNTEWRGHLIQDEEQSFKIIVKPVNVGKVGQYFIGGILYMTTNGGNQHIADQDVISVEIDTPRSE